MKILVKKSDNVIIDAGTDIVVTNSAITVDKRIYGGFKQADFQIVTVNQTPDDFRGGKYKYLNNSFVLNPDYVAPNIVLEKGKQPIISRLDFFSRITSQELVAIYDSAKQNSILEVMIDKCKVSEYIDLNDVRLIEGVYGLETLGLIAAGRAKEILCQDI